LVLLAISLAKTFPGLKIFWLYLVLFVLISVSYFFPQQELLKLAFFTQTNFGNNYKFFAGIGRQYHFLANF